MKIDFESESRDENIREALHLFFHAKFLRPGISCSSLRNPFTVRSRPLRQRHWQPPPPMRRLPPRSAPPPPPSWTPLRRVRFCFSRVPLPSLYPSGSVSGEPKYNSNKVPPTSAAMDGDNRIESVWLGDIFQGEFRGGRSGASREKFSRNRGGTGGSGGRE